MNIYNALIYKKLYGGGGGGEIEVESLTATENKTYNAGEGKAYNPVVVAIPEPTLISKNITANGNYSASTDNADGYSSVSVNVPLPDNAYLLKSIEHEQVATFTDGTDNFLKSLEVAIEPQQDLHGYDAPWVGGAGKNKLPNYNVSDFDNGTIYGSSTYLSLTLKAGTYTISTNAPTGYIWAGVTLNDYPRIYEGSPKTFTLESDGTIIFGIATNDKQTALSYDTQIEVGSTATTYEPYSNICPISGWSAVDVTVADDTTDPTTENVYTIDLDGTRYGGTLDVVSGVLTLTHGFISSYNGETLPSTWISDRDVYAEGTTPTIGAEVCYKLATPQTIQLTPTIIKPLQGENNFFASTGEIELLQYWSKEA